MPPPYAHAPLKSARSIRVIRLKPSLFKGPLACSLVEVNLDEKPSYKALSYTWDGQVPDREILCDKRPLLVTANCEAALHQFRSAHKTVVLWIDGICIDQISIPERNQQVAIMGEIYMGADVVLIWLGGANPKAKVIFKYVESVVSASLKCEADGKNRDAHFGELFADMRTVTNWIDWEVFYRSWFTRVWTLQEAVLAKSAVVYCGNDTIDFRSLLITTDPDWLELGEMFDMRRALRVHRELSKACVKSTIKKTPKSHNSGDWKPKITDFLASLHNQESTDPKDMIFSLYFIFKQMKLNIAAPDYTKPCTQVYTEMAKIAIEHDGGLDILHQTFSSGKWPELPSWVPDWSTTETPNSNYFGIMEACRHSSPKYGFHVDDGVLTLSGVIIDTVREKAGNSFGAKGSMDGTSRNPHQVLMDLGFHNLEVRHVTHRIGVYCRWVVFVSANSVSHSAEAPQDAFIRIIARNLLSTHDTPNFKKAFLIFKICVAIDEHRPQEEHHRKNNFQESTLEEVMNFNRQLNIMESSSIESAATLTKTEIFALGIHPRLRDFVDDPHHTALVQTREFRVFSAFYHIDDNDGDTFFGSMSEMALKDIFVTQAGYLGAAHQDIQKGDKIALFAGCKSPMVVREVGDKYRLMGPAHIPGIMNGENWPKDEGSLQEFMII